MCRPTALIPECVGGMSGMSNQNTFPCLKDTDQRVCSLCNSFQPKDWHVFLGLLLFCLWLDRLTHHKQQPLFVCPSNSLLSLYLALLLQALSLRYAIYLIWCSGPGRQRWIYHRHPQRVQTLSSQSLPLRLCNAIFSGKSTTTKKPSSNQSKTKTCHSKPQVCCLKVRCLIQRWGKRCWFC